MNEFYIGIDGYDSPYAGCTTHFSTFLLKKLFEKHPFLFLKEQPYLVRLNPNIPWRTRGNASIGIRLGIDAINYNAKEVIDTIKEVANNYSHAVDNRKGTITILTELDEKVKQLAKQTYEKALNDVLPSRLLWKQLDKEDKKIRIIGEKSIVGAIAAIGYMLEPVQITYELIIYRDPRNTGPRKIKHEKIRELEEKYSTLFNNYDYKKKRAIAIPQGPDPVLIGLRGTDGCDLIKAARELDVEENTKGMCLFATNQHTDAHAVPRLISELRVYQTGLVEGVVVRSPAVKKGGHIETYIGDSTGWIKTIFYAETKPMTNIARMLLRGDYVSVLGSVMPDKESPEKNVVLNAEKLWVRETIPETRILNPKCPRCGKRMKSIGRKGGYKCPRCGYKTQEELDKEIIVRKRAIPPGPYTPENGRIRHLVKPAYLENKPVSTCAPEPMESCVFP